jgi:hypothetical protein
MFDTPILFLIFNRPKETSKSFETIRRVRPKQLFIAADGPRLNKPKDVVLCQQTRSIIKKIDWQCEVKTLFRTDNLGCGQAISQAITWFFEHVEQGIIIEDDCVPNQSFFNFAALMLEKHQNDTQIMHISGTNHLFNTSLTPQNNTYFFSAYNHLWGWATWRRAWHLFDFEMAGWEQTETYMTPRFLDKAFIQWLFKEFAKAHSKELDTWGWRWTFCVQKNNGLCVTPMVNLVSNIGLDGVHYKYRHHHHYMPTVELNMKTLIHPREMTIDFNLDVQNLDIRQKPSKPTFKYRLYNKIGRIKQRFFTS